MTLPGDQAFMNTQINVQTSQNLETEPSSSAEAELLAFTLVSWSWTRAEVWTRSRVWAWFVLAAPACRRRIFQLYFSCAGLQQRSRLHSPTEADFRTRRREPGLCEDRRLPEVKRHRRSNWEKLDENLTQSAANSSLGCVRRVR